jgi:hypothetical protein
MKLGINQAIKLLKSGHYLKWQVTSIKEFSIINSKKEEIGTVTFNTQSKIKSRINLRLGNIYFDGLAITYMI